MVLISTTERERSQSILKDAPNKNTQMRPEFNKDLNADMLLQTRKKVSIERVLKGEENDRLWRKGDESVM